MAQNTNVPCPLGAIARHVASHHRYRFLEASANAAARSLEDYATHRSTVSPPGRLPPPLFVLVQIETLVGAYVRHHCLPIPWLRRLRVRYLAFLQPRHDLVEVFVLKRTISGTRRQGTAPVKSCGQLNHSPRNSNKSLFRDHFLHVILNRISTCSGMLRARRPLVVAWR